MRSLILIDGNAFMHRAYHALPKTLKLPDGTLINAVYGFASFLLHVLNTEKPDFIAITFDHKAPTVRHQEFTEYKATRQKADQEFYDQIPRIREIISAFNITQLEAPGYESDDLIATIAKKIEAKDHIEIKIYTGDQDLFQLIDKHIQIAYPKFGMKEIAYFNSEKVKEKFGLTPRQIVDYKALRGDPSDNIPGVKGIGEKGARSLLEQFGTMEKIYEYLEKNHPEAPRAESGPASKKLETTGLEIPEKIAEKLRTHKEDAFMSKKLATLIHNLEIEPAIDDMKAEKITWAKVIEQFEKYNFRSLITRIKTAQNLKKKDAFSPQQDIKQKSSNSQISQKSQSQDIAQLKMF